MICIACVCNAQVSDTTGPRLLIAPYTSVGQYIGFKFPNPGYPKIMYVGNNTLSLRSFADPNRKNPSHLETGNLMVNGAFRFAKTPVVARGPIEAKAKGVEPGGIYVTPSYGTVRYCVCAN